MRVLLLVALIGCAYANEYDDVQQVQQFKSVKGGHGGQVQYNPGANLNFFGQNFTQHGFGHGSNLRQNLTVQAPRDIDVGVCYIEIPTKNLVHNTNNIPAGNGSAPHLSRIRSCCKGYIRNIHNFRKCDPVCTEECVNGLCTAPETCTCFPDHVRNLAGFCMATCPIGCQNGECSGGECWCKEGYGLDPATRKYCVPVCKENCGGIGNCTAPNTCECKQGYQSAGAGACKPVCDHCSNGDCVAPGDCRCHRGYTKNQQGHCIPQCELGYESTPQGCKPVCSSCVNGDCVGPNECRCKAGYGKDHQGQCVAQCTPACGPSSRCISPNVCDPPQPQPHPIPYQPNNQYQPTNQHIYPPLPDSQYNPSQQPSGVPQCAQPCLNGYCDGNHCACNPGYVMDRNDPTSSKCLPNCPGGCPNGVCSGPNFCICNMGYIKDHSVKGRATCVRRAKRSISATDKPLNVADLLVFMIPEQ